MGNASVQRGLFLTFRGFPSSVTPYGVPPSPQGKATSRRGSIHRGPALTFRGPLHTRPGLRPVHPLQAGEGWSTSSVRAFGPATFPVGEGDLPAGEGTETLRAGSVGTNLPPGYRTWRGDVGIAPYAKDKTDRGPLLFSGPCVFWHCMVQCPKIGKRQVERGAFSVQSQDPAGHYGVLCEAPEPMAPG